MKYVKVTGIIIFILSLGAAFYGCKKAEEAPTDEMTAETAAETAAPGEEIACPAPGDDLICEECGILFQGDSADEEYAAHMEEKHPEKWAKMKDKFWEMRGGAPE